MSSCADSFQTVTSTAGIEIPTGEAHLVDDAADGLRRVAHAFADHIDTITHSESVVGGWAGEAKISFGDRCATQRQAIDAYRHGATDAATALRRYADVLRTHKLAIKRLADDADAAQQRVATAKQAASLARAEARDAATRALAAATSPRPDAAHHVKTYDDRATLATADANGHDARAATAAGELGDARTKAAKLLQEVKDAAADATRTLYHVTSDLPSTSTIEAGGELVLLSKTVENKAGITVFTIHIGAGNTVVTEQLADGDVKVTLMKTVEAGLDLTGGGKLTAGEAGSAEGGLGASASLMLMAALSGGKTFRFDNSHEAQKFVDDATHKDLGELFGDIIGLDDYDAKPIETFAEGSVRAQTSLSGGPAKVDLGAGAAIATKHDLETGADTKIYSAFAEASADLELLTLGASASAKGTSAVAVTKLRGNVTKLVISNAVETSAAVNVSSGDLKDVAKSIKSASGSLKSGDTKLVQTETELIVDKHNRALVDEYLAHGRRDPQAAHNLVAELDRHGQVQVDVRTSQHVGFELQAKADGFALEGSHTTTTDGLESSSLKPAGDPEYHRRRLP